ncbi:hypothetical protein DERF_009469 [Dermatophagoides farinae]|uniref:Uncharacterized protein n=1 Tax=Dermatophagoides farinae TaxID=6954 RepID=A0A922L1J0_DERFA|nr:hypothetical protein DERF_009469 [Dermatophagoides farinae]
MMMILYAQIEVQNILLQPFINWMPNILFINLQILIIYNHHVDYHIKLDLNPASHEFIYLFGNIVINLISDCDCVLLVVDWLVGWLQPGNQNQMAMRVLMNV